MADPEPESETDCRSPRFHPSPSPLPRPIPPEWTADTTLLEGPFKVRPRGPSISLSPWRASPECAGHVLELERSSTDREPPAQVRCRAIHGKGDGRIGPADERGRRGGFSRGTRMPIGRLFLMSLSENTERRGGSPSEGRCNICGRPLAGRSIEANTLPLEKCRTGVRSAAAGR